MATDARKTRGIRPVPERLQDETLRPFLEDVERLSRMFKQVADDPALLAGTGGTSTPGPPGPVGPPGAPAPGTTPDLTPPPTPTGLTATAGFANVFVQWDAAVYTVGHGNLQTNVYGAKYAGTGPLPTFSNAVLVGVAPQPDNIFILPTELGTQWHIWIKFQSRDGVESTSPAGGANGAQATTGKIGNADLGPLIVEAGNLASGAVTATKLAAGAVEFTKFAAGIEPVGVVGSLPNPLGYTGPRAVVLTTDGKLYRLVSGVWTAAVPAADISGQLTDAQIASIAAAKLTGQITSTQITDGAISTPKLAAGAVTAAQIAADTITAAQIAAGAITAAELAAGSVTTSKLNAGAVTANEIAANAITTAKIAAGAVNADQIAAGAVSTTKLLVAPSVGGYANPDPLLQDPAAWSFSFVSGANPNHYPAFNAGNGLMSAWDKTDGGRAQIEGPLFPVSSFKTYLIESSIYQWGSGPPIYYLFVAFYDVAGTLLTGSSYPTGWTGAGTYHYFGRIGEAVPAGGSRYSISFGANATAKIPAGAVRARVGIIGDYSNLGGVRWSWGGAQVREIVPGELIVDGAITANKIAANAIAVGSAAIQNGAIVNAMIANGTIDDAKIATLAAGKITAGSLGIGAFIQSNDYVSGVSGWRISGSGFAELGAASIRGQLAAAQLSAWTISAGRAIIADGTINTAKIEDASITNAKIGNTIQSVGYSPGVSGWLIRKSDGFAEFGAATIRGKLSAGNIIGSSANYAYGATSLTLAGGWVLNQLLTQGNYLQLEGTGAPLEDAIVEGEFHGYITMDMKASFAGGAQNYRATVICRPRIEVWNGSTWQTPFSDGPFSYIAHPILLTGSEQYSWPVVLKIPSQSVLLSSWTRARMVVVVQQVAINQLAVNGSAIKSDCIAGVQIVGAFSLRQHPN